MYIRESVGPREMGSFRRVKVAEIVEIEYAFGFSHLTHFSKIRKVVEHAIIYYKDFIQLLKT